MEQNNEKEQMKNDSGSKRTVLIVISILLIANAVLLWQFFNKKTENTVLMQEKTEITAEKDSITAVYNTVKSELSKLQADNADLQGKLSENDAQIKAQQAKIERLMHDNAGMGALRTEITKLKEMKTTYESRISDLEKENQKLTSENKELNTDLSGEKNKNENLSKENQGLSNKVALGSILKADGITVTGVKFKSSGKEVVEKKAKNVQKLKMCFTILENLVVEKGQKNIFLRVLGPDKSVLSTTSGTFAYNGQQLPYTMKQEMNYDNKKTEQCPYWEKGSAFSKGKYSVEIYAEGNKIGSADFELK